MQDLKELTGQVIEALKPIAQKIGQGAEAVYRMAVKDAFITGVESWIWVGVGVFSMTILVFLACHLMKDKDGEVLWETCIPVCFILVMFGFVAVVINLGAALHCTFNPEYAALKDLLRAVK